MNFYQIFLPAFSLIYFLQVFVIRSIIHWRKTGTNPFVFTNSDNAHDFIGKVFKLMILLSWFCIISYSFFNNFYQYLQPISYLDQEILKIIGISLLIVSYIWITIAQYHMATSWRIGINYNEKTKLVSKGVFSLTRNPIFMGLIVSSSGTFLITPNSITLLITILTYIIVQIQVRLEEEHLKYIHKGEYLIYMNKVRRWI